MFSYNERLIITPSEIKLVLRLQSDLSSAHLFIAILGGLIEELHEMFLIICDLWATV